MKTKKVFIILLWLFLIFIPIGQVFSADSAEQPSISAASAILLDNKTGKVLYNKN